MRILPATFAALICMGTIASAGLADDAGDKVVVKLPSVIDDVVPGGGGRFLFLLLKKLQKIAVFDVNEAKIVKYLPLPGDNIRYAAGAVRLVVVSPDLGQIQRWSLRSMEKDLAVLMPAGSQVDDLAMGWASTGPLLVMERAGPKFMDPETLKPAEITVGALGTNWVPHPQYPLAVRAGADGTSFAAWQPGISPMGVRMMNLVGKTATGRYKHDSAGILLPSFDGSLLFTASGVLDGDLKPVSEDSTRNSICLPSYHPAYFISIPRSDNYFPRNQRPKPSLISVYTTADYKLLFNLQTDDNFGVTPWSANGRNEGALSYEKRLHFFPAANLLVTVAQSRDALQLRRLRIADELNKSGIDYLFVDSLPPPVANPGLEYNYSIQVKSKQGGVKFHLDSGPAGMTITDLGRIAWSVPAHFDDRQASVIVSIKDASGQEIFHSFSIHNLAMNAAGRPAEIKTGK
jgi:hypothetical protein